MTLQNIDFTAVTGPVFDQAGNAIPREIARGVYRDDTNELMAMCGPNFKPIQHKEIMDPIMLGLEQAGYQLEERSSASRNALYDLQGKKGAWISAKTTDNGAVMRTDIILGDFIQPTGRTGYLQQGEDTNFFKISVLNSHNGKFAVKANTSYLRLLCMNGMTSPNFSAGAYGKHTLNFNVDGIQRQIGNAMDMMDQDAERFGKMARTKITPQQAEEMIKATIAKLPNKPNGEAHFSQPLVNKILGQFAREDQTVWGLYNAVTWWQTHSDMKASADRITGLISREQKVAGMLKSKEWKEVEFAL